MDIQKRIDRFVKNKLNPNGGSVKDCFKLAELIKITDKQGQQIIISIDSPGGYV